MTLVEMLSKKKTLEEKIRKEEARIQAVENRKLAELKTAYDTKQKALDQWRNDCREYLVDKPAVERFNAMMDQFTNERIRYAIERDVGKVSKEFLGRIQPNSMSTLISLYKLQGFFDSLSNCAKPQTATITEKEVLKAKESFEALKTKIVKRRGN